MPVVVHENIRLEERERTIKAAARGWGVQS